MNTRLKPKNKDFTLTGKGPESATSPYEDRQKEGMDKKFLSFKSEIEKRKIHRASPEMPSIKWIPHLYLENRITFREMIIWKCLNRVF
jgi:hypothetical protein